VPAAMLIQNLRALFWQPSNAFGVAKTLTQYAANFFHSYPLTCGAFARNVP